MHPSFLRFRQFLALLSLAVVVVVAAPPTDFTVESPVDGSRFRLAEARGKFVALHFLLKTECPFCLRYVQECTEKMGSEPELVHVFLKPDSAAEIQRWSGKLGAGKSNAVPIYRDPDAALAVAFAIPDGYAFHGERVHYPALVLLNPEGQEVFRYVGKDNTDRFRFEQLVAKLRELKKASSAATPQPSSTTK